MQFRLAHMRDLERRDRDREGIHKEYVGPLVISDVNPTGYEE